MQGRFAEGAPELAAEICLSSTAYDLHQKLELYLAAGVTEYVAVLLREQEIRWHRLVAGTYEQLLPDAQGVIHSVVFPGLWLDVPALLGGDMARVLATVQRGLESADHAAFIARLARQRHS
jgi:Uma2 family endonuclease